MCDRIALIQDGEFLKIDTPQHIIQQYRNTLWSVRSDRMSQLLKDLRGHEAVLSCFAFGDNHHVSLAKETTIRREDLTSFLQDKGHTNIELFAIEAGIEDCFMELTI